jgi:YesN/AraC family two-component response regulator
VKTLHLAVTAMKLGASDYLTKPFHETELLMALRRAVRAVPGPRSLHASVPAEGAPSQPRLLVVDRAAPARAAVAVALGRRFVVETAGDALRALRRVDASAPDLLIVDVPHGDNEAVQFVRNARARLPRCRVLVTTDAAPETQRALGATDVHGLLGKPVYADRLLDSAAALLALAAPPRLGRDRLSPRMARTLHHLAAHHTGDLRLDTIAAIIAMSPDHLAARFRAEVGLSLKEYVIRLRVEIAKVLMVDTDDTLETIAEAAGLCDASHLSRLLRQIAGMSPGEFRRRAKLA